jgi:hypothetical protein
MTDGYRHAGKPFLRMIELYVLWAIGELPQANQDSLNNIAPKLQSMYGGGGEWHEAIAAAMHMPLEMPAAIRDMWVRNLEIARANEVTLPPEKFAEMFVDENFLEENITDD